MHDVNSPPILVSIVLECSLLLCNSVTDVRMPLVCDGPLHEVLGRLTQCHYLPLTITCLKSLILLHYTNYDE